jgi:hypothetical protein
MNPAVPVPVLRVELPAIPGDASACAAPSSIAAGGTASTTGAGSSRGSRGNGRGRGGRGRGRGSQRSVQGRQPPQSQLADSRSIWGGVSSTSLDRVSAASEAEGSTTGYEMPGYVKKRKNRQQKKRQKFITGVASGSGSFKGAPVPSRSLFVYRVAKDTDTNDLKLFLRDMDFDVSELCCISHEDSKLKSFKLTVPVDQIESLLDVAVWPRGVRVRRYFAPKVAEQQPSD